MTVRVVALLLQYCCRSYCVPADEAAVAVTKSLVFKQATVVLMIRISINTSWVCCLPGCSCSLLPAPCSLFVILVITIYLRNRRQTMKGGIESL